MFSEEASDSSHLQIQFFSNDERFSCNFPNEIINVPASSESEQLNLLVNKIAETSNDNWKSVNFDFLIDSILLRTTLSEFIETFNFSSESVLKLECIQQTPAPQPQLDLHDNEWVAGLKILDMQSIFSINYGGELNIWSGSKNVEKAFAKKLDDDPLKCLDIFKNGNDELFALVGTQSQTLILTKVRREGAEEGKQKFKLTPQAVFRGHQRSVECLAINRDGTRAISGSFDKCVKVWNLCMDDKEDGQILATSSKEGGGRNKKAKIEICTKTPMVTLEAHREAVVDIHWDPLNAGQAVSVSWDHQMIVWDLELAGPIAKLVSNKAFTSLALNPSNGALALTGSVDPLIRMWDTRSSEGSMVKSVYSGHLGWVSDLCWSPNNEHLFISSSFDKTVKMWDTRSPKAALYDLMGHEDRVLCVDWSIPGRIASGSVDCSIKVFATC